MKSKLVTVTAKLKDSFFDREHVVKRLGKKRTAALRKAALTSRKIARRKLRRRKRVSRPGETPSVRSTSTFATLKNIQTGVPTGDAVILGPIGFGANQPAPQTLEEGLTRRRVNPKRRKRVIGGGGEIRVAGKSSTWRRDKSGMPTSATIDKARAGRTTRERTDAEGKTQLVTYTKLHTAEQVRRANELNEMLYGPETLGGDVAARPFMRPAMQEAAPLFPEFYAESLKGDA